MTYDVIICGGGPAGSTCAAFCAAQGLKTLVLERSVFPRDKVCGDCINPSCWPILEEMGIADRVLELPHARLSEVMFVGLDGKSISYPIASAQRGEIAVKRSFFDEVLMQRAIERGAEVIQNSPVTSVENKTGWKVLSNGNIHESKTLVAADGRNSTILRLLGKFPALAKDRVALQTHICAPSGFGDRVVLQFLPEGYCGYCGVGDGELNLCLVGQPAHIESLKRWAVRNFELTGENKWRTITPLSRRAVVSRETDFFAIGDAARVVEPFTGEGIFYAMASGKLAANYLAGKMSVSVYRREQARLYKGRLWVNRISKYAALNPRIASMVLSAARVHPAFLGYLTSKVVGPELLKKNRSKHPVP